MPKPKDNGAWIVPERVRCDQCELLRINGVICHEIGCPNSGKTWENGEWIRYYECSECGCDVPEGEECNCDNPVEGEN